MASGRTAVCVLLGMVGLILLLSLNSSTTGSQSTRRGSEPITTKSPSAALSLLDGNVNTSATEQSSKAPSILPLLPTQRPQRNDSISRTLEMHVTSTPEPLVKLSSSGIWQSRPPRDSTAPSNASIGNKSKSLDSFPSENHAPRSHHADVRSFRPLPAKSYALCLYGLFHADGREERMWRGSRENFLYAEGSPRSQTSLRRQRKVVSTAGIWPQDAALPPPEAPGVNDTLGRTASGVDGVFVSTWPWIAERGTQGVEKTLRRAKRAWFSTSNGRPEPDIVEKFLRPIYGPDLRHAFVGDRDSVRHCKVVACVVAYVRRNCLFAFSGLRSEPGLRQPDSVFARWRKEDEINVTSSPNNNVTTTTASLLRWPPTVPLYANTGWTLRKANKPLKMALHMYQYVIVTRADYLVPHPTSFAIRPAKLSSSSTDQVVLRVGDCLSFYRGRWYSPVSSAIEPSKHVIANVAVSKPSSNWISDYVAAGAYVAVEEMLQSVVYYVDREQYAEGFIRVPEYIIGLVSSNVTHTRQELMNFGFSECDPGHMCELPHRPIGCDSFTPRYLEDRCGDAGLALPRPSTRNWNAKPCCYTMEQCNGLRKRH